MDAKAKLLGHPIHQMLIVFPLGLLAMGVIFDLIFFGTDNAMFAAVAYWMMVAGVVGGLLAAPFGFIDWMSIPPDTRAKRIGALHGGGNLVVTLLFIATHWSQTKKAFALFVVGIVMLALSTTGAGH